MIDDRSIQRALKAKGHYADEIDGVWGNDSRNGVRAALIAAGVAETASWPDPRCKLAFQQLMLKDLGIEVGEIDGVIGPQTRIALEKWQNRLRGVTPREGEVAHQPSMWPRQRDVPGFYGMVGQSQQMLTLPYPMKLAWDVSKLVTRISVHAKVHASAGRAFSAIKAHYGPEKIAALGLDLYGGSLNVRKMRGGSAYSMHSWGIAIDFDPEHNQLRWGRDRARMARPDCAPFLDIWESEGWISLGRERNYDWMHVQAARL